MISVNSGSDPTIVFVSQLGTGGAAWQPVIDLLSTGAGSVTYDRPGTGTASPRLAPNPPLPYSAFADELAAELDQAGITGQVVVVGHSVGGLIARMFADRHPARVAGAVLVDGSIPRMSLWPGTTPAALPPPDGDGPNATHFDVLAGEVEILGAFVPDVPAAVVNRTVGAWPKGYPSELCDPLWMAYQRQAARAWRVPLVVAENSGHDIPADAPLLVAFLVDYVVRCARGEEKSRTPDPAALAGAGGGFDGEYGPDIAMVSTPHGQDQARKSLAVANARMTPEKWAAARAQVGLPPRDEPRTIL